MRGTKFERHTTEAEDEEVESEKRFQKLFDLLATGKNKVMQKLKRGGKKSSSFRKAA